MLHNVHCVNHEGRPLKGSVRYCTTCGRRTPPVAAEGGWWVCSVCQQYNE